VSSRLQTDQLRYRRARFEPKGGLPGMKRLRGSKYARHDGKTGS
jgi:hypothetical protein